MGKIIEETVIMTTKVQQAPTSEQLRIAQLCGDKAEDNAAMKEKCQKIIEMTQCTESVALIALHDCNNIVQDAIHKVLDGANEQGEWTTKGRKPRKIHSTKDADQNTPCSDECAGGGGAGANYNDENATGGDNSRATSRRTMPAKNRSGGGGFRDGMSRGGDFRGRGRGMNRGGRMRPRNENEMNNQQGEHSMDRSSRPGRGSRGFNDSYRGGRGGARGGMPRRHNNATNAEPGFDNAGSMSTWSNEPESNTWDNSMAQSHTNKWSNGRPSGGGHHNANNTWDNSMAQNVVSQSANAVANSNAADGHVTAPTNHADAFFPQPEEWEEEKDWHKMTTRVFTNSVVSGSVVTNSSSFAEPKTSEHGTGINSHIRGESIDVNVLFGQKPVNDTTVPVNDVSWSKQATDTLKNELGIGKNVTPNVEQVSQYSSRQYATKAINSKVEMPNNVANMGQIDVEFGEFSSLKSRADENSAPSANYFEFGSATAYTSQEMNLKQSGKDSSKVSQVTKNVYQQRTPSKDTSQVNGAAVVEMPLGGAAVASASSSNKDASASAGQSQKVPSAAADILSVSYNNASGPYNMGADQFSNNRSSATLLSNAAQQKSQSVLPSGMQGPSQQQQPQPQRLYVDNVNQMGKDSAISLASVQNMNNLNYNSRAAVTTTAANKQQINTTTIFNPATNPSYQALAAAAAMPYIYPAADQNYLNAATLSFLSPHGIPLNTLNMGSFPFDLSSLNQVAPMAAAAANNAQQLRDNQNSAVNADGTKQYQRNDGVTISGANSINAPPGLGPATVNNTEQAAQLLAPAGAAAYHPYSLMNTMQAPYFAPFVVPTVTNSSASTANSGNQYPKNSVFASPVFYSGGDLQDYSKNIYGMNMAAAAAANQQAKPGTAGNMGINANDVTNKAYQQATLKMTFDAKAFQNTATPPPGLSGVGFPTAFHSSGTYGAYPQFLPPQIGMMPPNMAQAATISASDVMSGANQRGGNPANKSGGNLYGGAKYWPN